MTKPQRIDPLGHFLLRYALQTDDNFTTSLAYYLCFNMDLRSLYYLIIVLNFDKIVYYLLHFSLKVAYYMIENYSENNYYI